MDLGRLVGATVAAAVLLASGCGTAVRKYECLPLRRQPQMDVHALWRCHREIISRALGNRPFTVREYREALRFFEGLTGIRGDAIPTDSGPVPGKHLARSAEAWDGWYERNRTLLYWDPEDRTVKVSDPLER